MLRRLVQLDVFVASADAEAAAATLGMPRDELLRDLDELEHVLGVCLVNESMQPTFAARRLAPSARDVLRRADLLFAEADALAAADHTDPALVWPGHGMAPTALADGSSRYLKVNDAFAELVGWSGSELIGTSFREVTYEGDLKADEHDDEDLFVGRVSTYRKTKRYITPAGLVRSAVVTCSRVSQGREVAYLSTAAPAPSSAGDPDDDWWTRRVLEAADRRTSNTPRGHRR